MNWVEGSFWVGSLLILLAYLNLSKKIALKIKIQVFQVDSFTQSWSIETIDAMIEC